MMRFRPKWPSMKRLNSQKHLADIRPAGLSTACSAPSIKIWWKKERLRKKNLNKKKINGMKKDISKLEEKIDIEFNDKDLLRQAIVHRSYLNENKEFELGHNERLEFLGDAVLELVITEYLYNNYPNPEGELTNWRASLVNAQMLSKISYKIELNNHLFLSRGEAKDTGRARQYILANAFEALIGAIYLDQGYEAVKNFIEREV